MLVELVDDRHAISVRYSDSRVRKNSCTGYFQNDFPYKFLQGTKVCRFYDTNETLTTIVLNYIDNQSGCVFGTRTKKSVKDIGM